MRAVPLVAVLLLAGGCSPARREACVACLGEACRVERADAGARDFFAGSEDLVARLEGLPAPLAAQDGTPSARPVALEDVEAAVRAAARAAGRRDHATVLAFGVAFPVRAKPSAYADAAMDAEAERAALDADEAVPVGAAGPGDRTLRLALLRMGEGPFRVDFRWSLRMRRLDAGDGRVLLRYDLVEGAPRERVSAFRGVAVVEPAPGGALVREAVVLASPVSPPFFLKGKVRGATLSLLTRRWLRLTGHAQGRR